MLSHKPARCIAAPFAVAMFALWSASSLANDEALSGLEEAIAAARTEWKAPGLAVAIVKANEVVFMKGFGTRYLGQNAPVNVHTLFTLASTTKAFVAMSIGMLVDDGKLNWDDRVIDYIPEFRVADPYVTSAITIRDLLSHRTGVEPLDILWLRGFDTATSLQHMQYAQQAAGLRTAWIYNNMMYVVAAEIVARVSGMEFPDFVSQHIFDPLGMTDSLFTRSAELRNGGNVAGAHLFQDGEAVRIEPYRSESPLGAAGIHSSVADMSKWLRFLLNEGSIDGKHLIKAETLDEMLKPQMLLAEINYPAAVQAKPHFFGYGFGWFLQDYKGRLLAMHTGSLFGANALVALLPEEELGLVILINADPVEYRHAFMYDVIDRFLHSEDKDWNADLLKLFSDLEAEDNKSRANALKERARDTQPTGPLTDYTGTFANPLVGETKIMRDKNGKLRLVMKPDAGFSLSHWSYDSFEASSDRVPDDRFLVTFRRGADGAIEGYSLANGRDFARRQCAEDAAESDACKE